jgi:hypothetical protein
MALAPQLARAEEPPLHNAVPLPQAMAQMQEHACSDKHPDTRHNH